ncbi:MAG: helix-turn-helix transcriptional regulator [Myxococcota bacterium]
MVGLKLTPNRVREFRERLGWTQEELARRAKLALRTIHSVEKGRHCRRDTLRRILRALDVPFEDRERVFPGERAAVSAVRRGSREGVGLAPGVGPASLPDSRGLGLGAR